MQAAAPIRRVVLTWLVSVLVAGPLPATAAPSVTLEHLGTFTNPVYVTHAGDDRLFIVERRGRILVHREPDGVLPEPFLDVTALVDDTLDGGLYAVAFHPRYTASGLFFLSYTESGAPLRSVISRYEVSAADPDRADPASAAVLIRFDQPHPSHNNDQLAFGPKDDHLYVSFGDGGGGGGPGCRAQHDDVFFGKVVRLDVGRSLDGAPFYGIPASNPFSDPADGILDEIWAKGFRNPWRFSFDRANGDLFVADVGQGTREEIDLQPAASGGGENYGWRVMEGTTCFDPDPLDPSCPAGTPSCFSPAFTAPIFEYPTGADCSIIGGYVYRGRTSAARGVYVFGDYCSGRIWALEQSAPGAWTRSEIAQAGFGLTSFGEGSDGELYATVGHDVFHLAFAGVAEAVCGDGVLAGSESCDDANLAPGDGCDAGCRREPGFDCLGEPSLCAARAQDYVVYSARATRRPDLPRQGGFPRPGWSVLLDDVRIANAREDDPENYEVERESGLALAAVADAGPAPGAPDLHYVRYAVRGAREGAGPFDAATGRYPRARPHEPRVWRLENRFGSIRVRSSRARSLWIPAHVSAGGAPPPPPAATAYLCYQVVPTTDPTDQTPGPAGGRGVYARDLQAFLGDPFLDADCALDAAGEPSFAGTPVAGRCLYTLRAPRELCNPVVLRSVGGDPPRATIATIVASSPADPADSLLCYDARLATRLLSQRILDQGLLAGQMPAAGLLDRYRQRGHVRRARADGPLVAPGAGFPAPLQVDTRKTELVCLATRVHHAR